jgi:hypothetical protein
LLFFFSKKKKCAENQKKVEEKRITLALSWFFLLDFQQVCQLLSSFTAKFGMDWRGSTKA